jgi:hypothetical protein
MEEVKEVKKAVAGKLPKEEVEASRKKLSYEELENVANQLNQQSQSLFKRLQEMTLNNFFTRLSFLFDILKNSDKFPKDFIDEVVEEIISSIRLEPDDEVELEKE